MKSTKEVKEKKCPSCGGEKEVRTWVDGEMDISTCGRCNGRGYVTVK